MSGLSLSSCSLSRRRFLKVSSSLAALGVAGAVLPAGVSRAFAASETGEVLSGSHFGVFYGKVEDGRLASVRPWEKDPRPAEMLDGVQDIVYSASRIRYPMVRRAYLDQGPAAERDSRGTGDFVRVSWDQALDLVAKEIKRLEDEEGPWALYTGSYGWRSAGRMNPQSMLKRLFNLMGGSVNSSSNYSKAGIEAIMPYVMGMIEAEGPQTTFKTVTEHSDLVVFWAVDPVNNNRISNTIPSHDEWQWIDDLKAANKKTLFLNPVKVESCNDLGGEWIAVRPQTDVALALGLCHTLLSEDLYDKDFIENYTYGFDQFADYLMGNGSDGVEKTADWASEITEIPADDIRDLAHRMVAGRTMLVSGWSPQRQHHGEQFPWALVTLASMIGQIGLPGGGFTQRYHLDACGAPVTNGPSVGTPISTGERTEIKAWPDEKGAQIIPVARIVDMLEKPGESYEHNGETHLYPDVKMTYWVGGNPFHHHQDRNRMRKAWKKFETVVVQDFEWTASARFADIVLPAASTVEHDDIDMVSPTCRKALLAMKKMIDPVFEARSDYDIFSALAEKLGIGQEFTEGKSEMDRIKDAYDAAKEQAAGKNLEMPEFEEFWDKGILEFEVPEENLDYVKHAEFREDPLLNMLPTPTGMIEIYSKAIEKMGYTDDCPPHPTWIEPQEWLGQEDKTFPLHVNSAHPKYRLHSQLCGTKVREEYTVAGREPCLINTQDAQVRGIADGDIVRVFNDRGQVLAGAVVSDEIRPGVVRLWEGGWYDPEDVSDDNTVCKYGDVNVLTPDIGTSRLAQGTSAATCMAQVEKFEGETPEVTVFTAPKEAA
ncbi:trimethylamine-N-oxide reductase TorA [Consotaella aegiceratis]|uniref:trimethylamine-N-oxide reductase TorA n=1 Tax=Consotaella aegiceratis TaxID=3097961 RepID=UPI002F3EFA1A